MEIQANKNYELTRDTKKTDAPKGYTPSFKSAMPALNFAGGLMQWIEDGGFLVSFLIQDFLGMTVPRTYAGFLRDKEFTGKYNLQEGREVLGRESLTGPCMMAVAPIALLVAAKCGKTTSVNSQLIKRFGNSLKEIVSKSDFDRSILNNKEKFKTEFYKKNINTILEQTVGKENVEKESVEYIMQQIAHYEKIPDGVKLKRFRGKARYKNECIRNIVEHINNIKYKSSSDLDMLERIRFGSDALNDKKVFKTKDAIEAMIKYSDDAIVANKRLDKLDSVMAESIKNKSIGKRVLTNISMVAATIGVMSILPKIYARSNVAPGARTYQEKQENKENNQNNLSFKGKNAGLIEKLGKWYGNLKNNFVHSELEYNGHNFTNTLIAGLSVFGLLMPRGFRAYNRAQKDENGKKDYTEIYEILIRDLTSSLAVVFAVPMATRACVTSYENKTGYVLMQKDRNMSKSQTILDLFNPYSKSHVLTNTEIKSLYDNIDSKEKLMNFCEYIDKNGGDLERIISKSDAAKELFNEKTFSLESLNGLSKAEKNKRIITLLSDIEKETSKLGIKPEKNSVDKLIAKVMKGSSAGNNKIAKFARGMNSMPAMIATLLVSPYLLGWAIPRLTYKNTRRIHEKREKEQKLKVNA